MRTSSQQTTDDKAYNWESEEETLLLIQGMTDEEIEQNFTAIMAGTVIHYGDNQSQEVQQ
jgi:hypothetical protein